MERIGIQVDTEGATHTTEGVVSFRETITEDSVTFAVHSVDIHDAFPVQDGDDYYCWDGDSGAEVDRMPDDSLVATREQMVWEAMQTISSWSRRIFVSE